ncbi:MAG: HAMP domain-containing histidine kinase [Bacteroidales bacterium]|jgi:signal transduction histidine kinase|nr:HAMP domain-containing histidine kinase [Bacteroidales bacterium]
MLKKVILIMLFIQVVFNLDGKVNTPVAEKGVIDLRQMQVTSKFKLKLNGEWEFYWNRMLRPHDFVNNEIKPDYYGIVPAYWTDYPKEEIKTAKEGFATYRLKVLLPQKFRKSLAIDLPVFDSSYDIYINGRYYGGNGVPGKTADETTPGYKRNFFRIDPGSDTLDIIINVANFSHRRGGFWLPVTLGSFSSVQRTLANSWAGEWATISLLLGFSLFFLFFFLIYPREKVMAFFCMATIGLAIRPLFTSHFLIHNITDLSWIWIVRFEYQGLYFIIIGWFWFAQLLYPSRIFKAFTALITASFSFFFVLTLFLPVKIFSYATLLLYPSMIILMVYTLLQSFIGILKKNWIDIAYFSAFVLLVAGGIHDISVSLGKSESSLGYIMTYDVVIFVFIQAFLLLYKWVKSYYEKDKLQIELEFMNKNLELLVNQRTLELKTRNEEIEKQNSMIAMQNKQLSDTLNLKNKIFSLIAHDLRSPVVNILYMLNLLKEKEYKEKYDTFANSSIQYAQLVISLLENMLVWGRGQEDKIKYSPEIRNLADIILTNLSIFKETADKKEIYVNFTQVGNSMAYFDKDLMDIIIRNLLSNAVKYTPRGGRISILLKDKTIEEGGILLKICDNGIGIPEAKQKYLFTATEVTSTPGTENERGTGLGLKLCYELVMINKGILVVESKEGEGSCFSIILPEAAL